MSDVKVDLRKFAQKRADEVIKVDLSKKPVIEKEEDAVQEQKADDSVPSGSGESEKSGEKAEMGLQEVVEGDKEDEVAEPESVLTEVTDEEETADPEPIAEQAADSVEPVSPQIELPEGINKLVDFINETGGTIDDYSGLNADYSKIDENTLLKEYYKNIKSHLDGEEVNFLIEENFSYDSDLDEERDIRKKKLAKKEEVAKARKYLDSLKSKYYEEIKSRPTVTNEQKKAIDFFNRYNQEKEESFKRNEGFKAKTKNLFTNDFKGFDFQVGEKKFRYGLKEPSNVADNQSDLNKVLGKFLDDKGDVKNLKEYHKALYAASNVDTLATHFYEQGKADAIKQVERSSKNISNEPGRQSPENVFVGGFKVKAIDGVDSSKLKIRNKN